MYYKYTYGAKRNKRHKYTVLFAGLTMLLGGVLVAAYVLHHSPKRQLSQVVITSKPVATQKVTPNYSLPTRLQIPKLQIDTHVIYVGLTKDGNMNLPANITDAGWYKYGALPGNIGTAVIAGHLNGLRGQSGVFRNLTKLVKGDNIIVIDSNGLSISFVVRNTRNYPQNAQPNEVFNSSSGSHLNLITCTGSWDSSVNSFAQRFVVFADKAS